MTDYTGIDYGLGQSNINHETGIHYGVISQHTVGQSWYDSAEADYGPPHCPKCGREANEPSEFGDTFKDIPEEKDSYAGYLVPDDYTSEPHECDDYVCVNCKHFFGSESAFGDEPIGYHFEDSDYTLVNCLDSDVMIIKAPYYTYAQYCSPCVPGAGNLDNPCEDGPKTYCLGHEWFEGHTAPYPVYCVADDAEVLPEVQS